MKEENIEKITQSTTFISRWSEQMLQNMGFADEWIKYINLIFLLLILFVLVIILQYLTRIILHSIFSRAARLPRMAFLQQLVNRRFPHYLAMIVPFSLVKGAIPIIFELFPKSMVLANKLADIYLIFYIIWLLMSVVNAFGDTLRAKSGLNDKPIDSYVQVVKIFLYFIGFIILFSILSGKNPMYFITGLGAASAILLLIFKDTILGFVASIQVSANDMVRIGDWITVPKHDADGDVIQITLTTVKIKNFDNTITTIPPYSLVSDSFQNWRGMQQTGSRRIKRAVFIKQSTIRYLMEDEVETLKNIQIIRPYIEDRQSDIQRYNAEKKADKNFLINGRNLTNMGLFRNYVERYLKQRSDVRDDMLLMVRQLAPTSKGIPLEIYVFAATVVWAEYERIMADIFDHITAAAQFFDLELFEDISNPVHTKKQLAEVRGKLKSIHNEL